MSWDEMPRDEMPCDATIASSLEKKVWSGLLPRFSTLRDMGVWMVKSKCPVSSYTMRTTIISQLGYPPHFTVEQSV